MLYSEPNGIHITQYACKACVSVCARAPQINPNDVQMTRIIKNVIQGKVAEKWPFGLNRVGVGGDSDKQRPGTNGEE